MTEITAEVTVLPRLPVASGDRFRTDRRPRNVDCGSVTWEANQLQGDLGYEPTILLAKTFGKLQIRILGKLNAISKTRYVCPNEMATAHAMLGNKDEAIGWSRKGVQVRSGCMPDVKTDPRLDALRTDPRFQDILRSLQFPQ